MITIAVDCMGGDHWPPRHAPCVRSFLIPATRTPSCCWWGELMRSMGFHCTMRCRVVPATEVVAMDDPVEVALRRKKDSSMRVAIGAG
jgi:glycerol-3-phosphate acyltransferase PlsX